MSAHPSTQPNILWICSDQQRHDTVHALGNERIHTPNLDTLVQEGVAFTRAYCQSPICTPSRASFLTGKYPSSIHVTRNGNAWFPPGETLISKRLADAGYDCGLIGKLHIASPWNGVEARVDDGYRMFKYSTDPWQAIGRGNQYVDWLLDQGCDLDDVFALVPGGQGFTQDDQRYRGYRPDLDPALHQTTWCANQAIAFIAEERHGPWLLSLNVFDPHPPFDAPAEFRARYDPEALPPPLFGPRDLEQQRRLDAVYFQTDPQAPSLASQERIASYYAMVELLDQQVGRILEALERTGQRRNTLVIFTSDHGEMLGDHGLVAKGCRFYEGLTRVPLIVSWPGTALQGVICDELVELTDLAPTLADIAGVTFADTHGISLLPRLLGDPAAVRRSFVRCEYLDALNPYAPRESDRHRPSYGTMYFDGRYKLVNYHAHGLGELYDLEVDPDEFNDLWDDPASNHLKLELLQRSFDASMVIGDPGPPRIGLY